MSIEEESYVSKQSNIIDIREEGRHSIINYGFKEMENVEDESVEDVFGVENKKGAPHSPAPSPKQSAPAQAATPQEAPVMAQDAEAYKDMITPMIDKIDLLSSALSNIENKLQDDQSSMSDRIEKEREDSYNKGLEDGRRAMREELEKALEEAKANYVESASNITNFLKASDEKIDAIEKELSAIAIDIAKEVVEKEISEQSSAVATSIAKKLIVDLKDSTKITLKANPDDFDNVRANLAEDTRVTVESDRAIAKGGVVIVSDGGNVDGIAMNRYIALKRNMLESKE